MVVNAYNMNAKGCNMNSKGPDDNFSRNMDRFLWCGWTFIICALLFGTIYDRRDDAHHEAQRHEWRAEEENHKEHMPYEVVGKLDDGRKIYCVSFLTWNSTHYLDKKFNRNCYFVEGNGLITQELMKLEHHGKTWSEVIETTLLKTAPPQ